MRNLAEVFAGLESSAFRSGFSLGPKERKYLEDRGMTVVAAHAREFVVRRLAAASPVNDGRQTPFRGHPLFVAQHATATCCRGCLEKWHRIPQGRELTDEEQKHVVSAIERWLLSQLTAHRR